MGIKVIWTCDFCGNQQQIDDVPEEGQEASICEACGGFEGSIQSLEE